jgi:hypothetical protein
MVNALLLAVLYFAGHEGSLVRFLLIGDEHHPVLACSLVNAWPARCISLSVVREINTWVLFWTSSAPAVLELMLMLLMLPTGCVDVSRQIFVIRSEELRRSQDQSQVNTTWFRLVRTIRRVIILRSVWLCWLCILWLLIPIPLKEFRLCYLYFEELSYIYESFWLCYNLYKYTPDRDSYLGRIQPHGLLQIMDPSPGGIWGIITSPWICHQTWQLQFPTRLLTAWNSLIGHIR